MFFHRYLVLFFLILRQPQIHTLFPYTTLFRSRMEPTSPARCFGAAVTRTLNTSVTKAPWPIPNTISPRRSEEHTSELQSRGHIVCRLLLEKKKKMFNCFITNSSSSN